MAYNLTGIPNTSAPDGTDPYGNLIDDPAGIIGTPLNKLSLADIFVFFQKMADEAGITLNDLPDNTPNTFQFWLALKAVVYGNWTNSGLVFENSGNNLWDNKGAPYGKFHYLLQDNKVTLSGVMHNSAAGSPGTPLIMTLPAAIRPSYKVTVNVWDSTEAATIQLEIATNGEVTPLSTGTGGTDIFFEGVTYKLGADSY